MHLETCGKDSSARTYQIRTSPSKTQRIQTSEFIEPWISVAPPAANSHEPNARCFRMTSRQLSHKLLRILHCESSSDAGTCTLARARESLGAPGQMPPSSRQCLASRCAPGSRPRKPGRAAKVGLPSLQHLCKSHGAMESMAKITPRLPLGQHRAIRMFTLGLKNVICAIGVGTSCSGNSTEDATQILK